MERISPGQDDGQLRSLLKEKEREYASLMEKHLKMTQKFRQLKENTKSWQAYHEKSVAKSAQKKAMRKDSGEPTIDALLHGIVTPDPSYAAPPGSATSSNRPGNVTDKSFTSSSGGSSHSRASTSPRTAPSGADPHAHPANPPSGQDVSTHNNSSRKDLPGAQEPHSKSSEPSSTQSVASLVATADQSALQIVTPCMASADDDSDSPVVVAERTLKRKRTERPSVKSFAIHGDAPEAAGSIIRPIKVKSEEGSSPITPANTRSLELVHDSLDLDEVGARNFTPRKRKRTYAAGLADANVMRPLPPHEQHEVISPGSDAEIHNESYYTQPVHPLSLEFWEAQLRKETRRREEQEKLDAQVPQHLRGMENSKMARQYLHNQKAHARQMKAPETQTKLEDLVQPNRGMGEEQGLGDGTTAASFSSAASAVRAPAPDVLQPTTPNVQILPRTSDPLSELEKRKLRRRHGGSAAVPIVAEDGENSLQHAASTKDSIQRKKHPALDGSRQSSRADALHRRLGGLLNAPTPEKPPLSPNSRPSAAVTPQTSIKRNSRETEVTPITRDVAGRNPRTARKPANSLRGNNDQGQSRPKVSIPAAQTSHVSEARKPAVPTKERLRDRQVHELHSDDFKINPAANHGLDFAYSDVVRRRDQRKCLPNCTKPECCGDKFNKIVKIGGFSLQQQRGLWDSSPVDEQEANSRLISEHFGLSAKQIDKLPEEEISLLLDTAKANHFANEYGKHRHVHERPASPPGFWRTEMPTTQELEVDKEKAKAEERRKVEERYKEAMRQGGRWLFRDE